MHAVTRVVVSAAFVSLLIHVATCVPGLRIDSVSPSPVAPGAELTLAGDGFADGLALALTTPTGVRIALQHVVAASATKASAQVPAAAPAGTYTLEATLAAATATLADVRIVPGGLTMHFLDVGQGDATLVVAPTGETLLIDGGPPEATVPLQTAVANLAGGHVDAVVLTHYHADHLGGLVPLLAGPDHAQGSDDDLHPSPAWAYVDDDTCTSDLCGRARRLGAWPFDVPAPGETFALGDVTVTAVTVDGVVAGGSPNRVPGVDDDDPNERSVAVLIEFAGRRILVEGDLTGGGDGEADMETPLAASLGAIDVLRTGHHGSNTSSSAASLSALTPKAIVISEGTDNDFCHPSAPALSRIANTGASIYSTGDGMADTTANCSRTTDWPANARHGLGTIDLVVGTDGSLTIAGDAL